MSRKAKSASSEKRKRQKQALRAQRKAQYAAFAAEGRTKGSRRFSKKAAEGVRIESHALGRCGNVGCRRCNPRQNPAPRQSPQIILTDAVGVILGGTPLKGDVKLPVFPDTGMKIKDGRRI